MLISRRGHELQLVTHHDHGALAGALAERWGGDVFAVPAPRDALVIAAAAHDDGWRELDDLPAYNSGARRPAHFLELGLSDTVGPYGRGVDAVYARDALAGALVSMHWAGLYQARWGVQDGPPVGDPKAAEVVEEQDRRRTRALRETWGYDGLRSQFEAGVWHAYEVLQALDFLSLALCLVDLSRPTDRAADALPMPATLREVDQRPGARVVPSVPRAAGEGHVDLTFAVAEPGVVSVDPWPFRGDSFDVQTPARTLPDREHESPAAAAQAFHAAPRAPLRATLVKG